MKITNSQKNNDYAKIQSKLDQRMAEARQTNKAIGSYTNSTDINKETIRGKSYWVVRNPKTNRIQSKLEAKKGVSKQVAFSRFNKRLQTFDTNIVAISTVGGVRTGETLVKITTKSPTKTYGKRFQTVYSASALVSFSKESRKYDRTIPASIKTPLLRGFSSMSERKSMIDKRVDAKKNWYGAVVQHLRERFSPGTVERLLVGSKQSFIILPISPKERTIYYALR